MTELIYEIQIRNHLDDRWLEWFQGETIRRTEDDVTVLIVRVPDQSALYGLLEKIRDLNLSLISITEKSIDEK